MIKKLVMAGILAFSGASMADTRDNDIDGVWLIEKFDDYATIHTRNNGADIGLVIVSENCGWGASSGQSADGGDSYIVNGLLKNIKNLKIEVINKDLIYFYEGKKCYYNNCKYDTSEALKAHRIF